MPEPCILQVLKLIRNYLADRTHSDQAWRWQWRGLANCRGLDRTTNGCIPVAFVEFYLASDMTSAAASLRDFDHAHAMPLFVLSPVATQWRLTCLLDCKNR